MTYVIQTKAGRDYLDWWRGRPYITVTLDYAQYSVACIEAELRALLMDYVHHSIPLHEDRCSAVQDDGNDSCDCGTTHLIEEIERLRSGSTESSGA